MNERIKELADQAWDSITVQDGINDEALDKYDQKFAELIIQECIGIIVDAVDLREPASTYVFKIKKHFGV